MPNRPMLPCALLCLIAACSVPAASVKKGPLTDQVQAGIRSGTGTFEHSELDALLVSMVTAAGRVEYAKLKSERAKLQSYLARLDGADLSALSREHLLALLINAYNAYTIDLILEHYPLASIKDVPGGTPWKLEFCKLGGNTVSLDFIEHNLLRPSELFGDPRIHFAVNCASIGCPLLRRGAYRGEEIDKQLDESIRNCMADPRYLSVSDRTVKVTKVLQWFAGDFKDKYGSVSKFLLPYVTGEAAAILEQEGDGALDYLDYDWSLNDAR
ncbi:MAG: DUF547 domain-containing protein [Planctomycetes bacterium]|nr:DUF547 domain-containing protein [Planctomycetota bacterium]